MEDAIEELVEQELSVHNKLLVPVEIPTRVREGIKEKIACEVAKCTERKKLVASKE